MKIPVIFLSYSHEDERDKVRLVTQINVLANAGKIDFWSDDRIRAGGDWKNEIDRAMTKADVAILLITANFLTSKFILGIEVPELLERHKEEGLNIFPIIARDCAWQEVSWLSKMNVRPKNGAAVWRSSGRYADRELAEIAREIAEFVKNKESDESISIVSKSARAAPAGMRRNNVEDAIDTINTELNKIKISGAFIDIFIIESIIYTAISYGAPLYNQGAIIDCAEIYSHTAKELVKLMDESVYGSAISMMEKMTLPKKLSETQLEEFFDNRDATLEIVYSALKETSDLTFIGNQNATKAAWKLRYTFDQISYLARGIKTVDSSLRSFGEPHKSFIISVERIIRSAISQSNLIYGKGLNRGENWIKSSAVIYLYAAQRMASMLPMTEPPPDGASIENAGKLGIMLEDLMPDRQIITDKNAYEIAWNIRYNFEHVLNLTVLDI